MRVAPKKGDCVICQAPETIRVAVNAAIWHEGSVVRTSNYRAAGCRAAAVVSSTMPEPDRSRYADLDPKTITRHADHVEETWREVMAGDRPADNEVPIVVHEFGSVMDTATDVAMLSMRGLRDLIATDPTAFAALRTKEAISVAKLGVVASGSKEASRIKRNQQKIDVMAIFAASSGHIKREGIEAEEVSATVEDLRAELADERKLLAARASGSADPPVTE